MKNLLSNIALILAAVIILSYTIWVSVAFFSYSCDAFTSGVLSINYAPGRCIND